MSPATSNIKKTPTVNLVAKSQLAKLLATENINIQHSVNAQTASFDTNTRTLILPVWVRASEDLYDMLVAHEIGHALHTPREDVYEPVCKRVSPNDPKLFFRYLNIVEDIRIENAIKEAFPGVRRSFYNGYRELLTNDFFGLKQENIADLSFADRLNIYAKGGQLGLINVPFTDDERRIVDAAMQVKTFDDVVAIAEQIFSDTGAQQNQQQMQPDPNGQNIGMAGDAADSNGESDANGGVPAGAAPDAEQKDQDGNGGGQPQSKSADQQEDNTNNQQQKPMNGDRNADGENEMQGNSSSGSNESASGRNMPSPTGQQSKQIKTDATLSTKIANLTNPANRYDADYAYFRLPTMNMDKVIFNLKDVMSDLDILRSYTGTDYAKYTFSGDKIYAAIVERNKNFVLNLVKQFEQKMAADTLRRTKTARTGQLDMRKIANYKFADDIFLRNTTVQNGKNHGMVFIMDWSGSMADYLLPTVEQLIALCLFCRRMNIPFDVYAFTNALPAHRAGLDKKGEWQKNNNMFYEDNYARHAELAKEYTVDKITEPGSRLAYTKFSTNGTLDLHAGMIHFLSSSLNNKDFARAAGNLCQLAYHCDNSGTDITKDITEGRQYMPCGLNHLYGLSSTPLNEAVYLSINIVNAFKATHRCDIVNTIFLTDGEPTSSIAPGNFSKAIINLPGGIQKMVASYGRRDDFQYCNEYMRQMFYGVEVFKIMTGANPICIRLASGREGARVAYQYHWGNEQLRLQWEKEWKSESFFSIKHTPFTEMFVIDSKTEIINNDDIFDGIADGASVATIARAFIKGNSKKATSRVLLSRFSDIIAKKLMA